MKHILSTAFSFFILIDAIGNTPFLVSFLKEIEPKKQRKIIFRELLIALAILILFNFLGTPLLSALGIGRPTVMISGGVILFLIALKMIFPTHSDNDAPLKQEPFIVPIAIPLIAGPAVLASIMIYSQQESSFTTLMAILIAWTASTAILLLAPALQRIMRERGIIACERLMGLILTMISIQMFLDGIALFQTHGPNV